MSDEIKFRWKVFAFFLGLLGGPAGAFILVWWWNRKLRKKGYKIEYYYTIEKVNGEGK